MSDANAPDLSDRSLLIAQIREAYGRTAYTHKAHEKQADLCFSSFRWQQRLMVGLTVVSSGTFLASITGAVLDDSAAALITSFIALLVTGINLGTKTFKHGELMQQHRDVAARVWNLRENYQSLIVDLQSSAITFEEGRRRRDEIQGAALEIYGDAPRTTSKAYSLAQTALKEKEDLTFSEREIDLLLPKRLRIAPDGTGDGAE